VLGLHLGDSTSTTTSIAVFRSNGTVDSTLLGRGLLGAAWSPDGRTIAATFSDTARTHLALLVRETGLPDTVNVAAPGWRTEPAWPAWSPSGDQVAFMVGGATMQTFGRMEVAILNIAQRAVTRRIPLPPGVLSGGFDPVVKARWSPDGNGILYCGLYRCLITNVELGRTQPSGGSIIADWSADGKQLIYFTFSNTFPFGGGRGRPSVTGFRARVPGSLTETVLADSAALARAGFAPFSFLQQGAMELSPSGRCS
jgi:dipeptidyl aminopeptidase/acylaminoacyl peptidase